MIRSYKKIMMTVALSAALCVGAIAQAYRCDSCAEKMAIKQSIQEALAAALVIASTAQQAADDVEKCGCSKPKPKPPVRVDDAQAQQAEEQVEKCGCGKPKPKPPVRAEREGSVPCDQGCPAHKTTLHDLSKLLKKQGHAAKKCCSHIKDQLDDIEDLVISVIDQPAGTCSSTDALLVSLIDSSADCCSSTDALLVSVLDQTAACCSSTDDLLVSIIDSSAACCSSTDALLVSVLDQTADCCSVTESLLGTILTVVDNILAILI